MRAAPFPASLNCTLSACRFHSTSNPQPSTAAEWVTHVLRHSSQNGTQEPIQSPSSEEFLSQQRNCRNANERFKHFFSVTADWEFQLILLPTSKFIYVSTKLFIVQVSQLLYFFSKNCPNILYSLVSLKGKWSLI